MAFVINVIKWLLWTVETMYFDVVEPVFYIYSNLIIFRLNQLGNSFNIFFNIWPTLCDAGPKSNQHWFNASCLLGCGSGSTYCWRRVHKLTPTQCLFNVGPASPVLASIHSALVSTSCWWYRHAGGTSMML